MSDTNFIPHEPSYTVNEFCVAERISRVALYDFWKQSMNGRCRRITHSARLEWQREMEARVENREELNAA